MDGYNNLVSIILKNETLAKAVLNMHDDGQSLNLVSKHWESDLENNIIFQNFSTSVRPLWKSSFSTVHYEYEDSKCPDFQVVLVGCCKFAKPYENKLCKPSIVITDSEPLTKIARAMTTDLGPEIQISNNFKFFFTECSILSCCACRKYSEIFTEKGYKMSRCNQPCILDTKVYDGSRIVGRFQSQMESIFQQQFFAILNLKINIRYNYLDGMKQKTYRISGNIVDMIAFNENKLTPMKEVDIGPLVNFEEFPETKYTSADLKCEDSIKTNECIGEFQNFTEPVELKCKNSTKKEDSFDEFESFVSKKRKIEEEEEYADIEDLILI